MPATATPTAEKATVTPTAIMKGCIVTAFVSTDVGQPDLRISSGHDEAFSQSIESFVAHFKKNRAKFGSQFGTCTIEVPVPSQQATE